MVYKVPFPIASMDLAAPDFRPPPPPLAVLDNALAALAEEFYEAAIDLNRWTGLLKNLAALFGATGGHVALYDFEKGQILLHAMASQHFEWPADAVRDYEDFTPVDRRGSLCAMFPGRAITHQDFDAEKVADEKVIQIAPDDLAQMMVVNDVADPFWGFYSVLKHKDEPHFTDDERARMSALAPAFRRAMAILRVTQTGHKELGATLDLIAAVHAPLGLFSAGGDLIAYNERAEAMLRTEAGDPDADAIQHQAGWAKAWNQVQTDGSVGFVVFLKKRRVTARLVRLPGSQGHILLELDVDANGLTACTDRFCSHYGLSAAERAVVELLATGQTINEIAARRTTTYETVRAQLRSVREKTGFASQEDIVRALLEFTSRLKEVA